MFREAANLMSHFLPSANGSPVGQSPIPALQCWWCVASLLHENCVPWEWKSILSPHEPISFPGSGFQNGVGSGGGGGAEQGCANSRDSGDKISNLRNKGGGGHFTPYQSTPPSFNFLFISPLPTKQYLLFLPCSPVEHLQVRDFLSLVICKIKKSLVYPRLCGQDFHFWKPNGGLSPTFSRLVPRTLPPHFLFHLWPLPPTG